MLNADTTRANNFFIKDIYSAYLTHAFLMVCSRFVKVNPGRASRILWLSKFVFARATFAASFVSTTFLPVKKERIFSRRQATEDRSGVACLYGLLLPKLSAIVLN